MEASLAGRAPGPGAMKACSVLLLLGLTGRVRWGGGGGGHRDLEELHTVKPTLRGVGGGVLPFCRSTTAITALSTGTVERWGGGGHQVTQR